MPHNEPCLLRDLENKNLTASGSMISDKHSKLHSMHHFGTFSYSLSSHTFVPNPAIWVRFSLSQQTIIECLLYTRCRRFKNEWETLPVLFMTFTLNTLIWDFCIASRWSCPTSSWIFGLKLRSNKQNVDFIGETSYLVCSGSWLWNTWPRTEVKWEDLWTGTECYRVWACE